MARRLPALALVVVVCGLLLTGLAVWATDRTDDNTERRLLQTQTRQAGTVLQVATFTIEQPMRTTLEVQRGTAQADRSEVFARSLGANVGTDKLFVSASLWQQAGATATHVASAGASPGLDPAGHDIQPLIAKALASKTMVVHPVVEGAQMRSIGFALADPTAGLVVYAERAIPADRRSPVDRDSAFADLHYAIYLGKDALLSDLTTTDVDPGRLPLPSPNARTTVPFGDTVLTLVASPRHHLGSPLSRRLPLALLLAGLALTALSAVVTRGLVESRRRVETSYGEQRAVSERLQRALLPSATPDLPGIEIATEYVASAASLDIGGDWYSVIGVDDERFAFVVGDVSGHGVDAVAEMARARFTVRAYLLDGALPHEALTKSSRQFDVVKDEHIITVLAGIGNRRTGEMIMANAGHPLPLLASEGRIEFVPMPVGPPLGTGEFSYECTRFTVAPGGTLIGFTDGLVERRDEDLDAGLARLAETVKLNVDAPLREFIDDVLAIMLDDGVIDDIAVLALRRTP